MKLIIYFSAIFSVILFSFMEYEVSAQGLQQFYGSGPIAYSQSRDDDDIGLFLTILLLATRNKGNDGCCGCCNCGGNNIPIPFPIPIPTSNPIITISGHNSDDGGSRGGTEIKEEINFTSENTSNVQANSKSASSVDNAESDAEAIADSDKE